MDDLQLHLGSSYVNRRSPPLFGISSGPRDLLVRNILRCLNFFTALMQINVLV